MRHAGATVRADIQRARAVDQRARRRARSARSGRRSIPTTRLGRGVDEGAPVVAPPLPGDRPAPRRRTRDPPASARHRRRADGAVRVLRRDPVRGAHRAGLVARAGVPGDRRHGDRDGRRSAARTSGTSRLNSVRSIELARITRAVVLMGLGAIVLDRAVQALLPRRGDRLRLRHRLAGARRLALDVPHVARRPAHGRLLPAPRADHRHRPAGDGPRRAVRDPPGGRRAGRRTRRLGARSPRRRALAPVAGELRRRRPGPRRRRRRRRRAVLERHQPGAPRRADPRRAAQRS